MMVKKIAWYASRLASMSIAEIGHRVGEQYKRKVSSISIPDFHRLTENDAEFPELPGIRAGLETLKSEEWLLQEWRGLARDTREGRIRLLGMNWPKVDRNEIWAVDPKTGKSWPGSDYCFRIDYRHAGDKGDVKYVWELNRLQYLQPIAALAAIDSDEELSRFCADELESWIDNNPPFRGINWVSGIELSCRIVSILVVISLIGSDVFSEAQRRKLHASFAAHGYWLYRFPSRFSSANNHLVAESGGLYLLGTLAPWLGESKRWSEYGRRILIEEAEKQIHEDGVGAEQSPTYLSFTLEWLLLCALVAERTGKPFPRAFWKRIEAAGEYLSWMTDSAGGQPRIGDDDEGRVFYSQRAPESYVSSIMGCLSTVAGRRDLAPPVVRPHLREAFFGRSKHGNEQPIGARCFRSGGYTVYRGPVNHRECVLVMDHGPLGYLSIAAHGHADALSIWLSMDGEPVLVDAGTYLYHSGGEWREHMRSTPAHNTLSIHGESSSRMSGAFNWSFKATTSLLAYEDNQDGLMVAAEHDGFLRKYGVRHRRCLEVRNGIIHVTDTLKGKTACYPVEIGFQFHPETKVEGGARLWTIYDRRGRALMNMEAQGKFLRGCVQQGALAPARGWYSPTFGSKAPAPRLVFTGDMPTNQDSLIRITPLP